MRIIVSGINGHMGKEVVSASLRGYRGAVTVGGVDIRSDRDAEIPVAGGFAEAKEIFGVGCADCIIDFSHHSCTAELLSFAVAKGMPAVLATTGQTEEELALIADAAKKIPVFFSANMSLGVALLVELAKKAAAAMPDAQIEIIEKHHIRKLDAPSGTAIMLANEIQSVRPSAYTVLGRSGHGKRTPEEIGIHAIRMGNIVGEHEVILGTDTQTITLKHEAHDRALFAEGALAAAEFLISKGAGLYNMHDIVAD